MRLGFTTLACPKWDLEQILRCAKENAYDGIDFRGYRGHIAFYELPEFAGELATTARRIREAGVEVPCLSSSARMLCPDAAAEQASLDEVRRYADIAPALGARLIRVFGGARNGRPWDEAIARAASHLGRLADAVRDAGVTLAVETHDDWTHTEPLAEAVRRAHRPNVGVLWDVHHPLQLAGEPLEQTYAHIGEQTIYTHVKDSRLRPDGSPGYCLPGEGQVPLGRIIAMLAGGGYDGYLTVEWEKQWHPELAEPQVALPAYARALREAMSGAAH